MTEVQAFWNDYYHGNWPREVTQPIVVKAGEGLGFTDPAYPHWLAAAAAAHQDAFAYYALHTGGLAEALMQANRAAALIGARPAMFDCEEWPAEAGSPAGMVTVPEICRAVDVYRDRGGTMNVIYLPESMWARQGRPSLAPLVARGLHLMNANYDHGPALGTSAWSGYGGMDVWGLQYAPCHNTARGNLVDLHKTWHGYDGPLGPQPVYHLVVHGETFDGIAAANGLTPAALHALNPQAGHPVGNLNLIYAGDRLRIK